VAISGPRNRKPGRMVKMTNSCAGELPSSIGRAVIGDSGRGVPGLRGRGAVRNERGDDSRGDIVLPSSGLEGTLAIVTEAAKGLGYSTGVSRCSFSLWPLPTMGGRCRQGRGPHWWCGLQLELASLSHSFVGPLKVSNRAHGGGSVGGWRWEG